MVNLTGRAAPATSLCASFVTEHMRKRGARRKEYATPGEQQFSFWILLGRLWDLVAVWRVEQEDPEPMVIKVDLLEPPLCLSSSPVPGKNGHGVVGLDAATSVRAEQVARHPTTLFHNENCCSRSVYGAQGTEVALDQDPRNACAANI